MLLTPINMSSHVHPLTTSYYLITSYSKESAAYTVVPGFWDKIMLGPVCQDLVNKRQE